MALKMKTLKRKIHLRDLNESITCSLCNGYLIDATALVDCHHVFCRGCILRHLETSKTTCPSCSTPYKKSKHLQHHTLLRPDLQMQALVYKVVPGLYSRETQRREDFYRSTGVRANSSCSDDSVLERERDLIDEEKSIASLVGDRTQFFGPDDSISLSLEYYQAHMDHSDGSKITTTKDNSDKTDVKITKDDRVVTIDDVKHDVSVKHDVAGVKHDIGVRQDIGVRHDIAVKHDTGVKCEVVKHDIAVKHDTGVKCEVVKQDEVHKVDDVKHKVNGTTKCGRETEDGREKRFLQCPAAVTMNHVQKFLRMKFALSVNHRVDVIYEGEVLPPHFTLMDVAYTFKWKRLKPMRFFYRIFTPLKIQPIKIVNTVLSGGEKQLQIIPAAPKISPPLPLPPPPPPPQPLPPPPKRDDSHEKEQLLATLELQSRTKVQSQPPPLTARHSVPDKKATFDSKKAAVDQDCVFEYEEPDKEEIKRFAEIRDREWALQKKLDESRQKDEEFHHHVSKKRKKNKHKTSRKLHAEITNKEEELKLKFKITPHNGHKHKHHKSNLDTSTSSKEKLLLMRQVRHKHVTIYDPKDIEAEKQKASNAEGPSKEWTINKVPTVQLERNEQAEQQVKKTVKAYQGPCYKPPVQQPLKALKSASIVPPARPFSANLEKKIANLQQRCTVEAKPSTAPKVPPQKVLPSKKYPLEVTRVNTATTATAASPQNSGFTVSKVDTSKRKLDSGTSEGPTEKRPSLEITLINPTPAPKPVAQKQTAQNAQAAAQKSAAKRPPPAPIPLDRIKKSYGAFNKSGISIIAKNNNNRDAGPLDLSSKALGPGVVATCSTPPTSTTPKLNGVAKDKVNMSNLQMLSKVATAIEASQNGSAAKTGATPKVRPPMPNLQTLKIPPKTIPNLDKLPKLTEINKLNPHQIRLLNPTIRNLRPTNQNQSIRNIPNPSLLIRQQNQNRLNSLNKEVVVTTTAAATSLPPPPPLKASTPEVTPSATELIPV